MDSNKLWFLKRINLLRCLSPAELERVNDVAQHRRVQRRQVIFSPDDRGDAIYLLKEGRVKLSRFDDRGKEITLAILEEGEFFGEEALAGEEQRTAYAEALEDSHVCRIEREDFESLLGANADLALRVAKQMSERLLGAQSRIESLAFYDVTHRLASTLLQLAEAHGEELDDGRIRVRLRLTHQELASLVGTTRETTTSILNRLKREGVLDIQDRSIVINQRSALDAIVSGSDSTGS